MERTMLQHAYLPKLIADSLGAIIGLYLLWDQQLPAALVSIFGFSIIGTVLASKQNVDKLSKTPLGKWMLVQAHPLNLITRFIGAIILAYGVWTHSISTCLIGVFIVILARYLSKAVS